MVVRRLAAGAFVLAYLAYLAAGTYWQLLGDATATPAATYFVTWDMFPGHRSTSERVLVVGATELGEFVQLYPSPRQRWRGGLHGDLTRLEFTGAPLAGLAGTWLEREIELAIERHDTAWPDDRVAHVDVVREFWPARYNVSSGDAPESFDLTGDPPHERRFHEVVLSAAADAFRRPDSNERDAERLAGQGREP